MKNKHQRNTNVIRKGILFLQDFTMCKILNGVQPTYVFDLMLEIKNDGEEFPVYKPGGKF